MKSTIISAVIVLAVFLVIFCAVYLLLGAKILVVVALLGTLAGCGALYTCERRMQGEMFTTAIAFSKRFSEESARLTTDACVGLELMRPMKYIISSIVVVATYSALFCVVNQFFGGKVLIATTLAGMMERYVAWCRCEYGMQCKIDSLRADFQKQFPDLTSQLMFDMKEGEARLDFAERLQVELAGH